MQRARAFLGRLRRVRAKRVELGTVVGSMTIVALFLASGALPAAVPPSSAATLGTKGPSIDRRAAALADSIRDAGAPPMSIPAGQVDRTILPWANQVLNGYHRTFYAPTMDAMAYDPAQADIWLVSYNGYQNVPSPVLYLDPSTLQVTGIDLSVDSGNGIALDPANGNFYITNSLNSTVWVVNDSTGQIAHASLTVGLLPTGIVYDSHNGYLYVVDNGATNISIIDPATETVLSTTVDILTAPNGIAYDPSLPDSIFVTTSTNVVSQINTTLESVHANVGVLGNPQGMAVNATNSDIFVTDWGANSVTVVDGATDTVIKSVPVGTQPVAALWDPANGYVYVADEGSDNLTVLSGATFARVISSVALPPPSSSAPGSFALVPSTGNIFIGNVNNYVDNVTEVTPAGVVVGATAPVAGGPYSEEYDPVSHSVFVWDQNTRYLYDLNSTTFASIVPPVQTIHYSPDYQLLFVPTENQLWAFPISDTECEIFNATTLRLLAHFNASVGNEFDSDLYDPVNQRIYVFENGDPGNLTEFNPTTGAVAGTYPVPVAEAEDSQMALDPTTNSIYIPLGPPAVPAVAVFSTTSGSFASKDISVPNAYLDSTVFDPLDGLVYIADATNYSLLAVNTSTNTLEGSIPLSGPAIYVAFDPDNSLLYVATYSGRGSYPWSSEENLTVISGVSFNAAFGPWTTIYTGFDAEGSAILFVPSTNPATTGELWVADSIDGSVLVVAEPPYVESFLASAATVDVGMTLNLTVSVVGGTGTLTFVYSNLPGGCAGTGATVSCVVNASGTLSPSATVTDGLGITSSGSTTVTVNPALSVKGTASATAVSTGATVSFGSTASGGTAPYTYLWSFGDGTTSTSASPTHAYSSTGAYAVTLTVTDSVGGHATYSTAVSVTTTSSPTTSGTVSTSEAYGLLAAGLVGGLVAGLVAGVLLSRRSKSGRGAGNPPSGVSGGPPPSPPS
jgi:YVTN family beta-propeller protein